MTISKVTRVSPGQLMTQMLELPGIVPAVQALEPEVLAQWIRHLGLEDAGELVALASPVQLTELFDDDLWRSERAGQDETFDADRFVLWLEVLLDSGVRLAMRAVSALDEDLLTLALCRNLFVIDIEALARRASSGLYEDEADLDLTLKELDGSLYQEIDQYRVIARNVRTFEPLRTLLLELDSEQPGLFARLLERCCYISSEYIDDNGGLYEVLTSNETVEADVAAEREDRRTRKGYVAPSAATSFLRHAREEPLEMLLASDAVDPMTHAYFRDAQAPALPRAARSRAAQPPSLHAAHARAASAAVAPGATTSVASLLATLRATKAIDPGRTPLLSDALATSPDEPSLLAAIRAVRSQDEPAHTTRLHELAYLANVLIAGDSPRRRALHRELRPVEAAQEVLDICERGAAQLLQSRSEPLTATSLQSLLKQTTMVKLFRVGWHITPQTPQGAATDHHLPIAHHAWATRLALPETPSDR